jgi:hypothetical protein
VNYQINSDGSLVNQGDKSLINPFYLKILNKVSESTDKYELAFPENPIKSLYVRGSVSVGQAKPPISDIDLILILDTPPSSEVVKYFNNVINKLIAQYSPSVTEIDLTLVSLPGLLYDQSIKNLKVYMKYQSVLLKGTDILDSLPEVFPGPYLAMSMYSNLEDEISSLRMQFAKQGQPKKYQGKERSDDFWCIWLMRTILRSSVALCSFEAPIFTQNLQECNSIAKKYYPEQSHLFDTALLLAIKPTQDTLYLLDFIDKYVLKYMQTWALRNNRWQKDNLS